MRVNIQLISLNNFLGTKNSTKNNYASKNSLNSDTFVKTTPSFGKEISKDQTEEVVRNFKTELRVGNTDVVLSQYAQNPDLVESTLKSYEKLDCFEHNGFDNKFGMKEAAGTLRLYTESGRGYNQDRYASLLNRKLIQGLNDETLKPLTDAIAERNPDFFKTPEILAMYANGSCATSISTLAKKDPEKVFSALESTVYVEEGTALKHQLAIKEIKITPERESLFETLYGIDPLRTSNLVSALPQARKNEFKKNANSDDANIKRVLDVIDSNDDSAKKNKSLLELYDQVPEAISKALLSPCKKTGELYVNSMMQDKKNSYHGIMLYILLKNPEEFFSMAEKSDCMWHAAKNQNQLYLDLMEQALFVDPKKTKELLVKPNSNKLLYPRTTPIMECVDNKAFDYTELFKAFYQEDQTTAFQLFASKAGNSNLLTYYVDKKGYMAEDFVSYLTNQNLRFAKSLLAPETLTEIKDLRYKTATKNLQTTKKELEDEFGRKLSESEKRVMERISQSERNFANAIEGINGSISSIRSQVDTLNRDVYQHLYPQESKRDSFIDLRCSSERYADALAAAKFHSQARVQDALGFNWHQYPTKPYDDGVV